MTPSLAQRISPAFSILACAILTASGCGQGEPSHETAETISVAPIFTPGLTLRYTHTLATEDTSDLPNAGTIAIQATVARSFSLEVVSVDENALAQVTITLDTFALFIQQNGATLVSFNSESPPPSPGSAELALLNLVGTTLEAAVDQSGSVVSMQSLSDIFDPNTPIQSQARPFYDDKWFRAAIENVWHIKTDTPNLELGRTWESSIQTPFNQTMSITTNHSYELVEYDDSNAKILGEGLAELNFIPDPATDLDAIQIDDQVLSFTLLWNRSLGALDLYETEQLLSLTYTRAGIQTTSQRRSNASLRRLGDTPATQDPPSSQDPGETPDDS